MTDLALYFAWHFGLSDWRTGQALGMSEGAVRDRRRVLGLKKTGGGAPVRFPSGWEVPPTGTIKKGRLAGATAAGQDTADWIDLCYPKTVTGAMRSCDRLPATSITRG